MTGLPPFDPNDYRKRVLAAVEKRGGPEGSDAFELYDLPLDAAADGQLDDADVAARIDEVWGFWQRQRDHPKYRVLVASLVEGHVERSAELRTAAARQLAAARVRLQREQRDSARYELLDAAVSRLVQRYGAIPRDKVEGLDEIGALAGLDKAEVAARLRRHKVIDLAPDAVPEPAPREPGISASRRLQIRSLLDEFGRLTDVPAPPTLLALLGLAPGSSPEQVRAGASAWRSRARELPPDRLRAVVDELLVHVEELLEPGRVAIEVYLDAVAADVTEFLRPRVRAAVLVEDRLVADDHAHLLAEAQDRGLDERRAVAVLVALAAELGTTIEDARPQRTSPSPPPPLSPPRTREWEEPLKAARAALRAGRPREARRLVEEAGRLAADPGGAAARPIRAVADEIDAVLADAELRRRAVEAALAGRRYAEALEHLEHLARTATDSAGPDLEARLAEARRVVADADRAVAAAESGPAADRVRVLLAVLADCADHEGARTALERIPLAPPAWVNAVRDPRGDVVMVLWAPSVTPEVSYRVSRQRPDGSWQVLGRVAGTSIEDGGAPPGAEAPVYAVAALQPGRTSAEMRSDAAPAPAHPVTPAAATRPVYRKAARSTAQPATARAPVAAPPATAGSQSPTTQAPTQVRAERIAGGSVRISWSASGGPDVEYRVRCLEPGGRFRVIGRTHSTSIEDGGAPPEVIPVYGVSAAVGGARSVEVLSAGM
ncbi:hypothetical protein [Pseudonocardia sp. GCM10023141]|uniref:hypothetical protein n=1 Tax=Pseudonocardia sp. GCM10023141 TaxID=3252653 RepID=UPI00362261A1